MSGIYPVILCGGSGTRLWPLSRALYPKQFIRFFDEDADSLLGATLTRLPPEQGFEKPTLVCNNDYRFLLLDELRKAKVTPREILLEPVARNTAPAIAAAAYSIAAQEPDAVMVVMPSDHLLQDVGAFRERVRAAAALARAGDLLLFGIAPSEPHTGYGYIRRGEPLSGGDACRVAAFTEKPDADTARRYLKDGGYFWNSGIFVMGAARILAELERLAPAVAVAARRAVAGAQPDLDFRRLEAASFAASPAISIDYAVMERTGAAAMLLLDAGWSDVGSWSSLWEVSRRDAGGNVARGDTMLVDTRDCYVHAGRALVATLGVQDLVVVDTPDAILVAGRDRAQDVGKLAMQLKQSNRREHAQHVRSHRPWGYFETLSSGPRFQVKRLFVKPGGKLSMQMHHHRSEHWVVVRGTAKVTVGAQEKFVCENESIYISATEWHRLENPGIVDLEIIEVQIGSYLAEDDIIRSEDIYQRAPDETR